MEAIKEVAHDKRGKDRVRRYVENLSHRALHESVKICLRDRDRLNDWKINKKGLFKEWQ